MTETPASTETTESTETAEAEPAETAVPETPAVRRRPARKPSKPDAVLAAAVDTARNGLLEVAGEHEVGEHVGAFPDAERLVTHRFAAHVPGYDGWHWFATLARVPRGKDATICEVGLLPSESALLAPDWVPWSERVRPEDTADEVAAVPEGAASEGTVAQENAGPAPEADGAETNAEAAPGGESPVA
ncbi:hypothetical protein GCM10027404_07870 [Arthrobacter tumbae]|uniref:DUF3027 domain-containing protein n=1 Tax=Arthrobacter tumbae TaxID=163874 RepID=UPI00195D4A48|nr:DUF3027 domain-containing protein [Arthrobacter tumbae]MBM7782072.1 hypothetical protein [Arthrobacter tumbae]